MKRSWLPLLKVSFIALFVGLTVACPGGGGGGITPPPGGGGPIPGGLMASFMAENPTPDPSEMTLSMAPGPGSDEMFSILVRVTNIDDFFGAGFRVNFDPATARFLGFDSTDSFILETGVMTDISAVENVPGELLVTATLQGQVAGVDPVGDDLLITLSFDAIEEELTGNDFTFGIPADRLVTTCAPPVDPDPLPACVELDDADLTWSGGTMTAMELG